MKTETKIYIIGVIALMILIIINYLGGFK